MLASLGYTPVVCASSIKALELFKEKPDSFDILVSDQVMPGMTGSQLLSRIREEYPDTVRMLVSGQADISTAIEAIIIPGMVRVRRKLSRPTGIRKLHATMPQKKI